MKLPLPTEHIEQSRFMDWLQIQHPKVYATTYAVPNGAHLARGFKSYNRLKREGLKKGVPDIIIDYPTSIYHGARIEFKRKGNKPSAEQIEFLKRLYAHNYAIQICYNFDEAVSFIENYLRTDGI